MRQHRHVQSVSIIFTAAAAILAGISADATVAGDSWRVLLFSASGASASAVIATLLWAALWVVTARENDEQRRAASDQAEKNLLIRTLSAVAPDGPVPPTAHLRPTAPLPLHLAPWRE